MSSVRRSSGGSGSGSKPASTNASPSASKRGSANAQAADSPTPRIADIHDRPSSSTGVNPIVSRPLSSSRTASGVGPVKGVYRPAAAAATVDPIRTNAPPRKNSNTSNTPSNANTPGTGRATPIGAKPVSSPAAPAAAAVRKPYVRRPTPDDSDYDSEEVVSEDECEEEAGLVHPPSEPLDFPLDEPIWDRLIGDEILEPSNQEYPSDLRLSLAQEHLQPAGRQLYPHASVEVEHQMDAILNGVEKLPPPQSTQLNRMSFSSNEAPESTNDLLYTDAHAPYTYSRHARPLTIWLIGKPLSGKRTLAHRLQRELGHLAQSTGAKKEWVHSSIVHITPEFLLLHAKESSSHKGVAKFPEIDQILQTINDGQTIDQQTFLKLFVYALHSERIAYHGYILSDLPFPASDLSAISKAYPDLVSRGVWPPQYVLDLELSNEEVLARAAARQHEWLETKLAGSMGFRIRPELPDGTFLDEDDGMTPSNPQSRPISASSRRGDEDGIRNEDELPYSGWAALHRPNDVLEDLFDEDPTLTNEHFTSSAATARRPVPKEINHTHILLESEASVQVSLVAYESTRLSLSKLLGEWSQFDDEPAASPDSTTRKRRTLNSAQTFHRLNGAQTITTLLRTIIHILGQNKWTRYALAQHLPFVAKEELKPIEEDEVREVLVLTNLNNSNPKEKEGSLVNLNSIPPPLTSDPSGLDLDTETLYDQVQHQFGVFQTFCPVTLVTEERLVEGSEDYCCTFQGHVYLMANATAMTRFQQNPAKFALESPPALPTNYVISIIGGSAVGKSTIANLFGEKYGWKILSLDGTEAALTRAAAITQAGGQFILDNGPATIPMLEFAQQAGLKIDKIVYLYVDDVEILPGRLRLAKKLATPTTEDQQRAEEAKRAEEAAAAAAAAAATADGKKKKSKGKSKPTASSPSDGPDDEPTQEEEDLMDRVEEFQNEWAATLLPYLEEHLYACTEVNNTTPPPSAASVQAPTTPVTPTSASASSAALPPASTPITPRGNTANGAPLLTLHATLAMQTTQAILGVFETTRQLVDPFYLYRSLSAAKRLTSDSLDRSKDDDRIPRAVESRSFKFNDTVFCPVCLIGSGLLVPGLSSEGVTLGAHTYSCCSRMCVEEFVAKPNKYNIHSRTALANMEPTMPALRIMLIGGRASGKSHLAKVLQSQHDLTHSFGLARFFYPALRALAQGTLDLVLAAEKRLAERKAAKEARRAARRQERKAKRAAERAAAGEEEDEEDASDEDDAESDSSSDDDDMPSHPDDAELDEEPEVLEERKDVLRDFLATAPDTIEHIDTLQLLLEADLFTPIQIENILRDIFERHAFIDPALGKDRLNNVAGWVCEVDLHNPILLARLEAVLKDESNIGKLCKPHVILPMDCLSRVATQRLVDRELLRRATSSTSSVTADDAALERQRKREAHKLKVELERIREAEALAAKVKAEEEKARARSAKRSGGAKKMTLKEKREAEAREKAEKEEAAQKLAAEKASKTKGKKKTIEAKADEAEASADGSSPDGDSNAAGNGDGSPDGGDLTSPNSNTNSSKDLAANLSGEPKEKSAAELAAEEELEKLSGICSELYKQSVESVDAFLANLRAVVGGFILLESVSGSAFVKTPLVFDEKIRAALRSFQQAQASLFITPIPITQGDADKILRNGMKTLRQYGSYCPCCILPRDAADTPVAFDCKVLPSSTTTVDCFPIVWGNNVVFTCSRAHRSEFISDARRYLLAPTPRPILSQSIIVLPSGGDGGRAAAQLATKLAQELNLVQLDMPTILAQVAKLSITLGRRIQDILSDGGQLTDQLLVRALAHVTSSVECLTQGWILVNFPTTKHQARLIKRAGIVPNEVVSLRTDAASPSHLIASASSSLARSQLLSTLISSFDEPVDGAELPLPDPMAPRQLRGVSTLIPKGADIEEIVIDNDANKQEDNNTSSTISQNEQKALEQFYESNYHTLTRIDSTQVHTPNSSSSGIRLSSLWQQAEYLLRTFAAHSIQRQEYRESTHATTFLAARPGRIENLGFTRAQLIANAAEFRDYCPICWLVDGILNTSSDVKSNEFTVEYHQRFYRLCSLAHRELFCQQPKSFASSKSGQPLPVDLPFQVTPQQAQRITSQQCELQGFCPVTISSSQLQGNLRVESGAVSCTAAYRGRVYRMFDARTLDLFLRSPSFYSRVTLPQKMPVRVVPHSNESLLKLGKTLGFMEQTFQTLLMRGLNSFEQIRHQEKEKRIKYPALPMNSSALLYLALYLKTHNPNNPTWVTEKYQTKLNEFIRHCQLIPNVAAEYRAIDAAESVAARAAASDSTSTGVDADADSKSFDDSKEQPPATAKVHSPSPSTSPSDAARLYDTIRAEMRAYAAGIGSRATLAQYFERYIR